MAKTPVYMPKFGMTMVEAEIVEWFVEKGQEVSKGDPLLSIETEKVNTTIEAPEDGFVGELLFEEGDAAEVGNVLIYIFGSEEEFEAEGSAPGEEPAAKTESPAPAAPAAEENPTAGERPVPKSRRIIADRMKASLQSTAQLTNFREICVDELLAFKDKSGGASLNDLLLKAMAIAALRYEKVRNQFSGENMITKQEINLGLAVALEDGLIVPVIHNVDRLSFPELATERKRLVEAARSGSLKPEEMGDAVGTLSNLGLQNIDFFTPILNTPESIILGFGAIREKPWVKDGAVVIAKTTTLSLTYDHQLLDGRDAAEYLNVLAEILQSPDSLSEYIG